MEALILVGTILLMIGPNVPKDYTKVSMSVCEQAYPQMMRDITPHRGFICVMKAK